MDMQKLVEAVKAHALDNYSNGGWDVVIETYEDNEIAEVITRHDASTPEQAIASFSVLVEVWAEREAKAASYREDFHSDGFGGDGYISSASDDYEPFDD